MAQVPNIQQMAAISQMQQQQMQQAAFQRTADALVNMMFELFKNDYKRKAEQTDEDFVEDCAERAKLILVTAKKHLK